MASITIIKPYRIQEQERLQEKVFSNFGVLNRILQIFYEKLKDTNSINCGFERTSLGGTGHTFLCNLAFTDEAIIQDRNYLEISTSPLDFVLKWEEDQLAENEILGAIIIKSYGFSAPTVLSIGKDHPLVNIAVEKSPVMESIAKKLFLIAMPKFYANTFKHALENKKIQRLSQADQVRLFESMGEIVPFDLLMGNNDRLISFRSNTLDLFSQKPHFNMGNVMIEFCEERFLKVHFIDNCTLDDLSEKKQTDVQEEEYVGFNIFGDQIDSPTQSDGKDERIDYKNRITQLNVLFIQALKNQSQLSNHVAESIHQGLTSKNVIILKEFIKDAIQCGIEKGFKRLESNPRPTLQDSELPFNQRTKELIELNLKVFETVLAL